MNKRVATVLTLLAAFIAVALPIGVALRVADTEARRGESARVLQYARDVVHRADATADQIDAGIRQLAGAEVPCSDENLALMRRIDLVSSYIQTIGHVDGTVLDCSSLRESAPIELGRPEVVRTNGVRIRSKVMLPGVADMSFIGVERDGYIAIIHKDLPLDISVDARDVGLATMSQEGLTPLTEHGFIDPRWLERAERGAEVTFVESGYIVAIVSSQRYATAAIASSPIASLGQRTRSTALAIVPVGLVAGIILAWAVLYLARLQAAMPAVIRGALKRKEFFLEYQPVVDLATGRWTGAEALIRWRRTSGELVRPNIFIPVAEDTGLIERVTERVLEIVLHDARDLFRKHPDFHLGVNLSAADLHSAATLGRVRHLAQALGARPGNLMMEITERGLARPEVAREVIRALRQGGLSVAIDDFGTGYSSLSYLQTFEMDFLKIDKAFVDTVATDAATSHVIPHIIEMAKSLKLRMIAEGVETEAQAQFLRERGVQYAQGFLFARPMAYAELLAQLQARRA